MQSVSQKIRTGLLELRTPSGLLYVSPTFSQRLYLLWIFRHFHSLSRRVLGRRQQEFIDKLSQTVVFLEHHKVARVSIIGAVENVGNITPRTRPSTLPIADKVIQMASARVAMPSAVGSEVVTFPQKRAEKQMHSMPEPQPKAQVAEISAPARKALKEDKRLRPANSSPSGRNFPTRNWLEWATGAALGAALLGVVFYVTEVRPSSISTGSRPVPLQQSESDAAPVAPPPVVVASNIAGKTTVSANLKPASVMRATNTPLDSSRTVRSRVNEAPPAVPESNSRARLHLTGAPDHNFVYPESPNSALTGTVNLRALIGQDGLVKHVDVLSGKPALARTAIDAMRHWRYRPPQSNGQAVEAETRVTINFVGDDTVSITFPEVQN